MFIDGDILPDTYAEWLTTVVVKALIDPETFPDWCKANGEQRNAKARTRYAAEKAAAVRK